MILNPRDGMVLLFNTEIDDRDLYVIEIGHSQAPENFTIGPWMRDAFVLQYVIKGSGVVSGNLITENHGFIIYPNVTHKISIYDDPWETYWILFNGVKAEQLLRNAGLSVPNSTFAFDWASHIKSLFADAIWGDHGNAHLPIFMKSVFYRALSYHQQIQNDQIIETNNARKYAMDAAAFINAKYYHDLKIDAIAKHINVSVNYLWQIFMEYHQCSPQKYLINTRIERAKELFRVGHTSVKEVALSVGYEDAMYFSRLFKKCTGQTPSSFIK